MVFYFYPQLFIVVFNKKIKNYFVYYNSMFSTRLTLSIILQLPLIPRTVLIRVQILHSKQVVTIQFLQLTKEFCSWSLTFPTSVFIHPATRSRLKSLWYSGRASFTSTILFVNHWRYLAQFWSIPEVWIILSSFFRRPWRTSLLLSWVSASEISSKALCSLCNLVPIMVL